jgi:hypothetical protein
VLSYNLCLRGTASRHCGQAVTYHASNAVVCTPLRLLQVGHTQVFLKEEGLERLRRAVRDEYHHHASVIQSAARRAATRMLIKRRAAAVLMIQKVTHTSTSATGVAVFVWIRCCMCQCNSLKLLRPVPRLPTACCNSTHTVTVSAVYCSMTNCSGLTNTHTSYYRLVLLPAAFTEVFNMQLTMHDNSQCT